MRSLTFTNRRQVYLTLSATLLLASSVVAEPPKKADPLVALVNETSAQFQLAYRQHPAERERRQAQLSAVVSAWQTAPRSEASNQQLATWLRTAIRNSMPGSTEPLPPFPDFAANASEKARPALDRSAPNTAPVAQEKQDDPFRDDPADE
jgi:hypothetical protein